MPISVIDHSHSCRVCIQNTQHSFHIDGDNIDFPYITQNLVAHEFDIFVPISPNINWCIPNNWVKTKESTGNISIKFTYWQYPALWATNQNTKNP